MANQIEGVTERLLQCAIEEFMKYGYAEASLRRIAAAAETSTSSIYVRFNDKAGLFSAIISDACDSFLMGYQQDVEDFNRLNEQMPVEEMFDYKIVRMRKKIDSIYQKHDAFKLLMTKAESSMFSGFLHRLADMECEQTERYLNAIHSNALTSGTLSRDLMHTLCSSYWSGIFEIVAKDMTREEAQSYYLSLRRFYMCGWKDLLQS